MSCWETLAELALGADRGADNQERGLERETARAEPRAAYAPRTSHQTAANGPRGWQQPRAVHGGLGAPPGLGRPVPHPPASPAVVPACPPRPTISYARASVCGTFSTLVARIRGSKAVRANAEGRSGLRLSFSPLAGIRGLQLHIEEHGVPPTYREFQPPGGDSRVATAHDC